MVVGFALAKDHMGGAIAAGFGIGLGSWAYAAGLILFVNIADDIRAIRAGLSAFARQQPDEDTGDWPVAQ